MPKNFKFSKIFDNLFMKMKIKHFLIDISLNKGKRIEVLLKYFKFISFLIYHAINIF